MNNDAMQNPLLKPSSIKDEAVPFDALKIEHFVPALTAAIKMGKDNIEKIKNLNENSHFENTIVALEMASEKVDTIHGIYSNLEHAHADEAMHTLAKQIYPQLSAYSSDILLDEKLFEKVKYVYDHPATLSSEQKRLLEKTYKNFVRNGALLSAEDKNHLRKIDQELSVLSPQFSENVLKATNAFELLINKKEDLEGLPEMTIEAAAHAAALKGHANQWLFNLQAPSYIPLITYSKKRPLREKIWKAYGSKAFQDAYDNQDNIKNILRLKHERAHLLGYKNHCEFVLEDRMAQNTTTVLNFLNQLLVTSKHAAQKDLEEIKNFAQKQDGLTDLQPWDMAYYSEKLKEQKYAYNEEELRPYFKLENVITGIFEHARLLYGIVFKESQEYPVYHPDVTAYEVYEENSQKYVGLFYTDFFPRETKKGGAWATSYRAQGLHGKSMKRPHVSIVCNFTKPTPTKPSLLTYDEVNTLFHEFGHALHMLLSNCTYPSLSGANTLWDFVELPSQIMENWVRQKESLDLFAKHYITNESMPVSLIEKVIASQKFQAGWSCLRQVSLSVLDIKWYLTNPQEITDINTFEESATSETRLFPKLPEVNISCSFSHIFAGGYSAGYYSYKWAEVLDADAFEYFLEKGLFNKEVARLFRENILERGDTEHPMELYKKFRGREPDPQALLRRDGLSS